MTPEIKFRGKSIKSNDWIYGDFTHVHDVDSNPSIIPEGDNRFFSVAKETVGQYTSRKDKNGKDIYKGDIIKLPDFLFEGYDQSVGDTSPGEIYSTIISEVVFLNGSFCLKEHEIPLFALEDNQMEVLGNISDNPELIKHEAQNHTT